MNYWVLLDIMLVAVFLGSVYLVARNGLIKTIAFLIASAIALVGAYHLTGRSWQWGADKIFTPLTEKAIVAVLGNPDAEGDMYKYLDTAVDTVETAFEKIKAKFFTSEDDESHIKTISEEDIDKAETLTSVEKISTLVGKYITIVVFFWIFFAFILAILRVAIDELSFVNRIPIIGISNQVLGLFAGIIVGYLILAIPIYVIETAFSSTDLADANTLTHSTIINYILRTLK